MRNQSWYVRLLALALFLPLLGACQIGSTDSNYFEDPDGGWLDNVRYPLIDRTTGEVVTYVEGKPFTSSNVHEYTGVLNSMANMTVMIGIKTANGGKMWLATRDLGANGAGYLVLAADLAGKATLGAFGYLAAQALDPDQTNVSNDSSSNSNAKAQGGKGGHGGTGYGGEGGKGGHGGNANNWNKNYNQNGNDIDVNVGKKPHDCRTSGGHC